MQAKAENSLGIEPATLVNIYRQMARIRAVDKGIQAGLSAGKFLFAYWPATGQEVIPATISQLTTKRDYMVTTYRGIHDQVAKGLDLEGLFSEALARIGGVNKGKGGAPHISDPASGSMLTTAIVGAGAPIANGLAFAAKSRGEDRVTIVNFGDGATSIGAVHEAMNFAGSWKLPVIFLCQNNQWGEYTPYAGYTASKDLASRAAGYGFKGVQLDGNDPVAFYKGMKEVIDEIRAGNGPIFVEAKTYRLGPHAGIGDNHNAPKEELQAGKAAWPVPRTRALIIESGAATEAQLLEIEEAARIEVETAMEKAMASPSCPKEEMLLDVYADASVVPVRGQYPRREAEVEPTGETKNMLMLEAVIQAQATAIELDKGVFSFGEDVGKPGGVFGTTKGLQAKYGADRVLDTPIAEQAIIGCGVGAALVGMRPIAEIMFNDFAGVCMDPIFNHAAKQRFMSGGATSVPMVIRMMVGGGLGGNGAQHSQSLEAWFTHVPGLKVVMPSTPFDAKGLLLSSIFDEDPVIFLESIKLLRGTKGDVPVEDYRIPLGVAKVRRVGTDITLVSYGWEVHECIKAAEELQLEGISAEVIDLRTLVPIDYARVLDSVKKTRRALVVHAATEFGGFGAEIASTIGEEQFSTLKAPVGRLGAAFAPIGYSKEVEFNQIPYAKDIAARVRQIVSFK